MKAQKSYLIKAFLIASALILVVYSPGYCAPKKFPTAIINLLLTDSTISMKDTATKAAENLGGPVNAALSILLAADRGYSWVQIVDAIEVGNLKADGSIPGVSPEGDPQGIITVSEQSLVAVENTSLITVSKQSQVAITNTSLLIALDKYVEPGGNVLEAILNSICTGYSLEQIVLAIMSNTLRPDGRIKCTEADDENDCLGQYDWDEMKKLEPIIKPTGKILPFKWNDCKTPPNIQGIWGTNYGYTVTIVGDNRWYTYTGTGDGNFKHTGLIIWDKELNVYEGDLEDVEGYCCGNVGYLWLKAKDENTISIISYWTTPDGTLVKDNTTTWEDLFILSRDVDNY